MTNPTVYLAGPVQHTEDGGKEWRDETVTEYGDKFDFHNPLWKYNVPLNDLEVVDGESGDGKGTVGTEEIVANDKKLIRNSDAVLIGYQSVESAGTAMETMFAYKLGLPVVLWIRGSTPKQEVPIWYRYHTDEIRHNLGGAMKCIWRLVD